VQDVNGRSGFAAETHDADDRLVLRGARARSEVAGMPAGIPLPGLQMRRPLRVSTPISFDIRLPFTCWKLVSM
jgi:hypothetical protein